MKSSAFFLQYANNKFMEMHTKYQCHPKRGSMLNCVPSSHNVRRGQTNFQVQTCFQSRKPKQNISKSQNFLKNISREPIEDDVYQGHTKSGRG